ncbi:MAG: hypothetical protein ACOY31_11510 [Bacillota bacterium]
MFGVKRVDSWISRRATEYFRLLLLAMITFLTVCLLQYFSTIIFGLGEFADGSTAGKPVSGFVHGNQPSNTR